MDHAAHQRQTDAGPYSSCQVSEPVGELVHVQVDCCQDEHDRKHEPGQSIHADLLGLAAASISTTESTETAA